ncbi:MAG: J domain-containing protein [Magnetococcus sp. YQC-9]
MEAPSLIQRIYAAREILGIGEEATLAEIEARVKVLLKRWHPDRCPDDPEQCAQKTREILAATKTLRHYCAHYRYSFRVEEVEKHLSPAEWMEQRFGGKPYWASAKDDILDAQRRPHVTGKNRKKHPPSKL